MSFQSLLLMLLMVGGLCGVCLARKKQDRYPRNITHCDSGASSSMDGWDWNLYKGRWYVSKISAPLGPSLRDVSGYATDIDVSSIEANARDKAYREFTVERKETLVNGDGRECRKRTWRCRRERGTSKTECVLKGNGGGVIVQRSVVLATDYLTTAAVYRETYISGQFLSKQINLLVRDRKAEPNLDVIKKALMDYCGDYAANPGSEFYKSFSNDSSRSCFLP